MCSTSCFMPSIVFFLSSPSALWTIGSRRILSGSTSCSSSHDVVVIVSPLFVVTWLALILILVVGGSTYSGLCIGCCCSDVLSCLGSLPCVISSGCCPFGNGSGCLLVGLVGAVAFGKSRIVSRCGAELASADCSCCWVVSFAVACCFVAAGLAGINIAGCNTSVGVTGVHGGLQSLLILSMSGLSIVFLLWCPLTIKPCHPCSILRIHERDSLRFDVCCICSL